MQLSNHTALSSEEFAALTNELAQALPSFGTLQQFVMWGARQQPPARLIETIALDEYTHDVLAAWHNNITLVFGAT